MKRAAQVLVLLVASLAIADATYPVTMEVTKFTVIPFERGWRRGSESDEGMVQARKSKMVAQESWVLEVPPLLVLLACVGTGALLLPREEGRLDQI